MVAMLVAACMANSDMENTCLAGKCGDVADDTTLLQSKVQSVSQDNDMAQMLASDIKPKKDNMNAIKNHETKQTPTCLQELEVRKEFSEPDNPLHHGSEMLRLVFHDALDFNNLHDKDGNPLQIPEPYGGVDGCLFSGGAVGEDGKYHPDPGHNNGLRDSIRVSTNAQNKFPDLSKADIKVAAAIAALEEDARGPHVPMTWGRQVPLDCEQRAGKYQGNIETNVGSTQWIHTGPDILSFDHQKLLDVFEKLGLTQEDMVALMGAHSYGDVSQCSKVLNKVEVGNFCNTGDNKRPEHYEVVGGHDTKRPVGKLDQHGRTITESGTYGKWLEPKSRKYDDGAVWDQTPACFDNRYFSTFAHAKFEWKDGCCGTGQERKGKCTTSKRKRGKCAALAPDGYCYAGRGQDPGGKTATFKDGTVRNGGDICDATHPWCRSNWPYDGEEKRDKTTMRNVYDFGLEDYQHPANDDGSYNMSAGWMKPIFRMPPEWSLLSDATSRELLQKFANSEKDFFDSFNIAFSKVLEMTPQKDSLATCAATDCSFATGSFKCGEKHFPTDSIDCHDAAGAQSCKIVQVIGTRAVINCDDGTSRLCCEGGACKKPLRAWQHKQGTALGTCFDGAETEPNTGDSAVERDQAFKTN